MHVKRWLCPAASELGIWLWPQSVYGEDGFAMRPAELDFGSGCDQNMVKGALPCSLQSLTFGADFNQCMQKVALPCGLQSLTFG